MSVFNIDEKTLNNNKYRQIVDTYPKLQITVMSIKPQCSIGKEVHKHTTQFIKIEKGHGIVTFGEKNKIVYKIKKGSGIIIPPNTVHNVINLSKKRDLKLYSIYTPKLH